MREREREDPNNFPLEILVIPPTEEAESFKDINIEIKQAC